MIDWHLWAAARFNTEGEAAGGGAEEAPTDAPTNESSSDILTGDALDDAIRAGYDEAVAKAREETDASQPRDANGRYVSKDAEQDEETKEDGEEKEAKAEDEDDEKTEEDETEDQAQGLDLPARWAGKVDADVWAKTPAELQEFIHLREKQINDGISKLGQQVKAAEPLLQLTHDNAEYFQSLGKPPTEAIHDALSLQSWIVSTPAEQVVPALAEQLGVDISSFAIGDDPAKAITDIAAKNGIDLLDLVLGEDNPDSVRPSKPEPDPRLDQVTSKLESVEQYIARIEQERELALRERERQQHEQIQHEQSQNLEAINEVAKSHPEIDTDDALTDMIIHLAPVIRAENPNMSRAEVMSEAAERAKYALPVYRSKLIEQQATQRSKQALSESTARAERAKSGRSSNVKGNGKATAAPIAMDDEIMAYWKDSGLPME